MSTSTHTMKTYFSATIIAAGSWLTSSWLTHSTAYGGVAHIRIRNSGGGGPTVPATASIWISPDTLEQVALGTITAGTATFSTGSQYPDTALGEYTFVFNVPPGVMYTKCDVGGSTVVGVTGAAYFQELTSV